MAFTVDFASLRMPTNVCVWAWNECKTLFATQTHGKQSVGHRNCLPYVCMPFKRICLFYAHIQTHTLVLHSHACIHGRSKRSEINSIAPKHEGAKWPEGWELWWKWHKMEEIPWVTHGKDLRHQTHEWLMGLIYVTYPMSHSWEEFTSFFNDINSPKIDPLNI